MNRSHLQHALVALILQCTPGFGWGDWVLGGALAVGFFWGREHAQAEYKWIQGHGGKRTPEATTQAMNLRTWSLDMWLDATVPTAVVVAVWWWAVGQSL